jgi:hypothetical protein
MILGLEIAMLIMGIIAIRTEKLTFSKTKVVTGPLARLLGYVLVAPLPLAFLLLAAIDLQYAANGKVVPGDSKYMWMKIGIEAMIVIGCGLAVCAIGLSNATDPNATAPAASAEGEPAVPAEFRQEQPPTS